MVFDKKSEQKPAAETPVPGGNGKKATPTDEDLHRSKVRKEELIAKVRKAKSGEALTKIEKETDDALSRGDLTPEHRDDVKKAIVTKSKALEVVPTTA